MSGTKHLYTITGRRLPSPPHHPPSRSSSIMRLPTYRYDPGRYSAPNSAHNRREMPHDRSADPSGNYIPISERRASQVALYNNKPPMEDHPDLVEEAKDPESHLSIEDRQRSPAPSSNVSNHCKQARESNSRRSGDSPCLNRNFEDGSELAMSMTASEAITERSSKKLPAEANRHRYHQHEQQRSVPPSEYSEECGSRLSGTQKQQKPRKQLSQDSRRHSHDSRSETSSSSALASHHHAKKHQKKQQQHHEQRSDTNLNTISSRERARSAGRRAPPPAESSYRPEMPLVPASRLAPPAPKYTTRAPQFYDEGNDQVPLCERVRAYSASPNRNGDVALTTTGSSAAAPVGGTEILPDLPHLQGQSARTDDRYYRTIVRFIDRQPESQRAELERMLDEFNEREQELCEALTEAYGDDFEVMRYSVSPANVQRIEGRSGGGDVNSRKSMQQSIVMLNATQNSAHPSHKSRTRGNGTAVSNGVNENHHYKHNGKGKGRNDDDDLDGGEGAMLTPPVPQRV